MIRSLGARLFAAALLFLFLALLMTWLTLTRLFENHLARQTEAELQAIADTLIASVTVSNGSLSLASEPADTRFSIPAGGRYWEIDGLGGVDLRSRSLWDSDIGDQGVKFAGSNLEVLPGPSGDDLLVLTTIARFDVGNKEVATDVHAASDKAELDTALAGFRSELLRMLAMTGLFLALGSALQIFVGLRPLAALRKAVSSLRRGETDTITMAGPSEVKPLITEINTLMADGRGAVERARQRASDLAHGLKTPLTILGQLGEDLAKSGMDNEAGRIAEQVTTIRGRVDRQLALARSAGANKSEHIDVEHNLQRLAKAASPVALHAGITLDVSVTNPCKVRADLTDLMEATGNVLDNALRHANSGVTLSARPEGQKTCIEISDDGDGIDEADRQRVLERGIRLDETSEGSGLGLAISADILRAYGGSIEIGKSAKGGLSVRMYWPGARPYRGE